MKVGPHTGGGGLLPPIHAVRHVTFASPAAAALDAVEAELRSRGNQVHRLSPHVVEFENSGVPGVFDFSFMGRARVAGLVRGGRVTFDPAAPEHGLRVDLRFNAWLAYALPCLCVAAVLVQPVDAAARLLVLVAGAVGAWINYTRAAGTYVSWIGGAAARAQPLPALPAASHAA
ncbi:MAG TPA: hypothetical protein VFJ16_19090 [Longimicrobium sp.]|nr:hypothetical protein [Longimicrobium sp.]